MAVSSLVTTAGASDANAYVTVATATQYHEDRVAHDSVWTDAADKRPAILEATSLLDQLVRWAGCRASTTQALEWPRTGLTYPSGVAVPSTAIPVQVQHATAELAKALLAADRAEDTPIDRHGLEELEVPGMKFKFAGSRSLASTIPGSVMRILPSAWATLLSGMFEVARA